MENNKYNFDLLMAGINKILEKLNNISANPPPQVIEIITQDELCKRLMISKPTLIRWVKKDIIPQMRIGDLVRYNYYSVIKALEGQNKKKYNERFK